MHTLNVILAVILFCSLSAQENMNTFIYKFYQQQDTARINFLKKNGISIETRDSVDFIFQRNDSLGTFYPEVKINNSQGTSFNITDILVESHGEYFYNYKKNIVLNAKKEFIVEINEKDFNWEIMESNIPCYKYICKKAKFIRLEAGMKQDREFVTEVLFTEDFPSDVAPFGLIGLKGVIVEVRFGPTTGAVLTEIKEDKKLRVKNFTNKSNLRHLTQKEFEDLIKKQVYEFRESYRSRIERLD